jgi:hypothetical protein
MDAGLAAHLVKKLWIREIEQVPGHAITPHLHAAFRRDLPDIVDLFNSGLAAVHGQDTYDMILSSYGLTN